MPIICGTSSRSVGAHVAAHALARSSALGPVYTVDLDHDDAFDADQRAVVEYGARIVVVTPRSESSLAQLARRVHVPLLVVREPLAFVDWAAGRRSLRVGLSADAPPTDAAIALLGPAIEIAPDDIAACVLAHQAVD
jgi:hypothetical protein